jgi:hypothetical protein
MYHRHDNFFKFILFGVFTFIISISFSQKAEFDNYDGEYAVLDGKIVRLLLSLQKGFYGINYFGELRSKNENDSYGDVIIRSYDFEGTWKQYGDTLILSYNGDLLMTLQIIDSLRLRNMKAFLIDIGHDTLYRLMGNKIWRDSIQYYWILTFYQDKGTYPMIFWSDIEDTINLPINPMWTFFNSNYKVVKQYIDSSLSHPLSKIFFTK